MFYVNKLDIRQLRQANDSASIAKRAKERFFIKQHVLQWLRQQLTSPHQSQPYRLCKRNDTKTYCDSAIGQHLLDNEQCALNYDNKQFSILAAACSSFQLNLFKAAYIKTWHLVLRRQKEFVYTLKLLDNHGVLIWPLAALSLPSRYSKIFLWCTLQY